MSEKSVRRQITPLSLVHYSELYYISVDKRAEIAESQETLKEGESTNTGGKHKHR